jgi:gluconolactonase
MSSLAVTSALHLAAADAHEGPVYAADEHALYFTTVPRDLRVSIKRLDLSEGEITVVREDANMANGMTLAPDGRLLVCEQGTFETPARISAVDRRTGEAETIVAGPLSSPNDIVVRSDGTIWFTDPSYGFLQGFRPEPAQPDAVYRYDPAARELTAVASDLDKPNGLAFSPDEQMLYVGDNGTGHELRVYDVDGVSLVNGRVVAAAAPGHPDGVKVDAEGRIYASAPSGIQIFEASGELVDELVLPGAVNFTFGGARRNVLYITADTALWAAVLDAKGA